MQEIYDQEFVARIQNLPTATISQVFGGSSGHEEVKLQYTNKKHFETMAKQLKIMSDLRVSELCMFTIL